MAKSLVVKIVKNKANGQASISIPLKKLSKKGKLDLKKAKQVKIKLEEFY